VSRLVRLRRRAAAEDGFTLIELLIASTLSLIIMGASMAVFTSLVHRTDEMTRLNDAQDNAATSVTTLARQLRNLASPTPLQPKAIDSAGAYDLVFQTVDPIGPNADQNKVNVRRLRYCLGTSASNNTKLYLQTQRWTTATTPAVPSTSACPGTGWTATRMVTDSVNNKYNGQDRPIFGFNSSTDVTAITRVTAKLWIDPQPTRAPKEVSLTTSVDLRNQNRKPSATFSITQSTGQNVILNGSDSDDPEGQPLTYGWVVDGAKPCQGSLVVCTATLSSAISSHTITLTVTDNAGLTDAMTKTYTVPG
jgi:prepilin-type N-terminal cleavage/methylation domain-containing protein